MVKGNIFLDIPLPRIILSLTFIVISKRNVQSPKRRGQALLFPRSCSMPRICERSRPTVTANWLTVPSPPRRLRGAISLMYIGTSDVFSPVDDAIILMTEHKNLK